MNGNGVLELVLKAVKSVNNGDSREFHSLVSELNKKPLEEHLFCSYLLALRRAIKYMNKQHETLIGVILKIDWVSYQLETVNLFIEFLGELVSAKTYYVKVCIRSLIKQFVARTELPTELHATLKVKCEHIHTALQTIVHIAPLSSKYVAEAVKVHFPYTGKCLFILETYVVNILQLTVYIVDARYNILLLLIDKLLSIDVHIPRHELEKEIEKLETVNGVQFEFEENKDTSANVNASKLDQLMTILFAYIESVSFVNGALDYDHAEVLVEDFLQIYESLLIKTQSSYVQFVLFYMTSFHKNFANSFIEACWKILQDPNYASVLRQAAACYLSSFLGRARFVEKDIIKEQIKRLSEWVHRYIDFRDDSSIRADRNIHAPFYSACQALFYIFLYHYKLLLETPEDIKYIKSINLVRIVTSQLNPLKFCLNSVVNIFARITRMYEIVFCYSIIERNNRTALEHLNFSNKEVGSKHDGGYVFFPFDPYKLPKSSKWITPLYVEWNVPLHDDESDDDDTDDFENDDVDLESVTNNDISSSSFGMICISPGFQLLKQNLH